MHKAGWWSLVVQLQAQQGGYHEFQLQVELYQLHCKLFLQDHHGNILAGLQSNQQAKLSRLVLMGAMRKLVVILQGLRQQLVHLIH